MEFGENVDHEDKDERKKKFLEKVEMRKKLKEKEAYDQ